MKTASCFVNMLESDWNLRREHRDEPRELITKRNIVVVGTRKKVRGSQLQLVKKNNSTTHESHTNICVYIYVYVFNYSFAFYS